MTVLMYHPRFAPLIVSGQKTQTIRPPRKRPIKVGDPLSHRQWKDKAYRSPMVTLLDNACSATFGVFVSEFGIELAGSLLIKEGPRLSEFAQADGFSSWREMLTWYMAPGGYGLPFVGVVIQWEFHP